MADIHTLSNHLPYPPMSKTKILNLRIEPELKKQAKKIAEKDGRTLSNWVTVLIRREVEKADKKG